jgi:hypothetical protein
LPRHHPLPADTAPDWQAIEFDGDRVRFARPLLVDFGGIAKGYAVDAALALLRDAGLTSARVNAGGDLAQPTLGLHLAGLGNGAVATSAGYYQATASPLRHPHTGSELAAPSASACWRRPAWPRGRAGDPGRSVPSRHPSRRRRRLAHPALRGRGMRKAVIRPAHATGKGCLPASRCCGPAARCGWCFIISSGSKANSALPRTRSRPSGCVCTG